MAKDPAFLFYPGDWLGGTMGMTFEEKGAYLELLLFQFNNGKFELAQAKQVLSICSASVFEKVVQKFDTDGKMYWKQKLHDEIERRKKFTQSRRNNAKSNKSQKKTKEAYAQHMETETETIISLNKESIKSSIFSDQKFIDDLKRLHKGKDLKDAFEQCWIYYSLKPNPPEELWEWRQKLSSWLIYYKPGQLESNSNKIQ
jgi:uncharacterized protein YdaU (DUF1376 family)